MGFDYVKADGLRTAKIYDKKEIILPSYSRKIKLPKVVPVYEIYPLLDATQELFGTVDNRKEKFPPMPGCHVPFAAKSANSVLDENNIPRAGYVWSYIALYIAHTVCTASRKVQFLLQLLGKVDIKSVNSE